MERIPVDVIVVLYTTGNARTHKALLDAPASAHGSRLRTRLPPRHRALECTAKYVMPVCAHNSAMERGRKACGSLDDPGSSDTQHE